MASQLFMDKYNMIMVIRDNYLLTAVSEVIVEQTRKIMLLATPQLDVYLFIIIQL